MAGPRKHRNDRRISPETAAHVKKRDRGCIAALWLGAQTGCRDAVGNAVSAYDERAWEFDHINDHDLGVSHGTADRLAIVCSFHHRGGWATSHRVMMRAFVRRVEDGMDPRKAGHEARDEAIAVYGERMSKGVDKPKARW